jgi:hypothetical protein
MKNKQVMTLFALLMLAYQGWRVFDYMGGSLQGVSDTVRFIVSVAFLAFSELGILIWLHIGQPQATTERQEATASLLIWVDFFGSMLVGLADLAKHNTLYQVNLAAIDPLLFMAPWLMVVLNIGGYLVYTQNDSDTMLEREERRMKHEEHKLEIAARHAAIRDLHANKDALAEKLAPHYVKDLTDRVTGRTYARFERKAKAEQPAGLPPLNGNKPTIVNYNSEADQVELVDPKNRGKGEK